jgi:hypothetical protein
VSKDLDKKNRHLRAAIEESARQYGCGFSAGWVSGRKSWVYHLTGRFEGVEVVVLEDGSDVFFVTWKAAGDCKAKTARGIAAAFSKLAAL